MKRLLNTLYVTGQGSYLGREGETIYVRQERQTKLSLPIHTIGGIVCFGNVTVSPFLMGFCGEKNVEISFLTERGRFLARVAGQTTGNVLLRKAQYRRSDSEERSLEIARVMVGAKIANARTVLVRARREGKVTRDDAFDVVIGDMAKALGRAKDAKALAQLRGSEGEGARSYFSVFDELILHQKDVFSFSERSRRPPLDEVNAMLSFAYTLLVHDLRSALEAVGLDPYVGFLHRDRPGRPSLALDLMEEFRSFLADRLVLTLINRKQIRGKGFERQSAGGVFMDDGSRKTLLTAYQQRKQEELQHPFLGESVKIGLLPHVQAQLLARHIRGDLDAYPPFLYR